MGANMKNLLKPIPVMAIIFTAGTIAVEVWLSNLEMAPSAHWIHRVFIACLYGLWAGAVWKISRICDTRHHQNFQCTLTKGHQGPHSGVYVRIEKVDWWTDNGKR